MRYWRPHFFAHSYCLPTKLVTICLMRGEEKMRETREVKKTLEGGNMKKVIVVSVVCFATVWLALLASSAFAHPSTWGNIHTHDAKGNDVYRDRPPKEVRRQNEHNRQMQDKLDRQYQQLEEMQIRQSQQLREMQRMRSGY